MKNGFSKRRETALWLFDIVIENCGTLLGERHITFGRKTLLGHLGVESEKETDGGQNAGMVAKCRKSKAASPGSSGIARSITWVCEMAQLSIMYLHRGSKHRQSW